MDLREFVLFLIAVLFGFLLAWIFSILTINVYISKSMSSFLTMESIDITNSLILTLHYAPLVVGVVVMVVGLVGLLLFKR